MVPPINTVHGDAFVPLNIHSYGGVLTGVIDDPESVAFVELPVAKASATETESELEAELEDPPAVSLASEGAWVGVAAAASSKS